MPRSLTRRSSCLRPKRTPGKLATARRRTAPETQPGQLVLTSPHDPGERTPMTGFVTRMLRAAQLDAALYEEVEADPHALRQATAVVVLSSLAAGVGSHGGAAPGGTLLMTLANLLGRYVSADPTCDVGARRRHGQRR